MLFSRRSLLTALATAPLASALPRQAFAAYPDHPIRLIVPFAAGGNADFVARITAEGMSHALGQSIVVEIRAGAGGSLGAAVVAAAPPDGYTLLTGSNGPLVVNPFVQAKLGYEPLTDFVPIGLSTLAPHVIAVHETTPAKTLAELIALSKKQAVTIGMAGVGSATHMTAARFNVQTGANLSLVPYRGGGALVPDMLAGQIMGAVTEMSTVLPHRNQGKIRVLAVASEKRMAQAPEVSTMIENGVKDFTAASFVGVLAPAKTPADIVATLEKALIKALADKAAQEKFINGGAELVPDALQTSQGFGDYIRQEYARAKEAAKVAGLKPE